MQEREEGKHRVREGCRGRREAERQGCWERLYHFSIRKHTQFLGYSMMINHFKMGRECRMEGSARQGGREGSRDSGWE